MTPIAANDSTMSHLDLCAIVHTYKQMCHETSTHLAICDRLNARFIWIEFLARSKVDPKIVSLLPWLLYITWSNRICYSWDVSNVKLDEPSH